MATRRKSTPASRAARDFKALLADDLRTGNLRPVYVLEGEDQLRIEQVATYIRSLVLAPGSEAFNDHVLDAETAGWASIIQQARSCPMFGGRQVVWARHADQIKPKEKDPHEAALADYLGEPIAETILIISGQQFDARRRWVKVAKEAGFHVQFTPPKGRELLEWIGKAAAKSNVSLDDASIRMLADLVGSNLRALQAELDKLSLLEQARGRAVTACDLPWLILEQIELETFSLTDAAGPGRSAAMLKNWQVQSIQGRGAEEMIPILLTHLRRAVLVSACLADGLSIDEIQAETKLNGWLLRNKLVPLARSFDAEARHRVLLAGLECDAAIKSRPLPSGLAGERLLADLGAVRADS